MARSTKKTTETPDTTYQANAGMVAAMAAFSPVAMTAWFDMVQESMRFMSERLEKDLEAQRAMLACKTPQELMQVQSDFMKKAFTDYTEETRRMMEMMGVAMKVDIKDTAPTTRRNYDDVPV
ncbi:phasin family protein [Roseovarius sp. SK2]|jgi:hypothetical protein|uniref:phasin family protein n=1 Tax=Roseovarius TaxID=74030 RepID=UPI00237BC076|nr:MULTISPECIES: phasin family protein [unclassified Roseovarius]MDD9724069.1 phasin family protein [Roseovarius sp. SK2]